MKRFICGWIILLVLFSVSVLCGSLSAQENSEADMDSGADSVAEEALEDSANPGSKSAPEEPSADSYENGETVDFDEEPSAPPEEEGEPPDTSSAKPQERVTPKQSQIQETKKKENSSQFEGQETTQDMAEKMTKEPRATWYRPELVPSGEPGVFNVVFSGKTEPGTRLYIPSKKILKIVTQGGERRVVLTPLRQVLKSRRLVKADEEGYFSFTFQLGKDSYQIPFRAVSPYNSQMRKAYDLSVTGAEIMTSEILSRSPFLRPKYRVWAGAGVNFQLLQQDTDIQSAPFEFSTISFLSPFIEGTMWLSETWGASLSAKISPGETESSEGIEVTDGSYQWMILTGEATHYPSNWKFRIFDKFDVEAGYRVGVQQHSIPFIYRPGPSTQVAAVGTSDVTMLTGGGQILVYLGPWWIFEGFMRYQLPVRSDGIFDIKSSFSFDGSIGAYYKLSLSTRLGLYWYGQLHSHQIEHLDPVKSRITEGTLNLFYSNIDVRFGWEF